MDLTETVETNKMIMRLIESKYTELFPAAYTNIEARYYNHLLRDTYTAESAMKAGGIAEKLDARD